MHLGIPVQIPLPRGSMISSHISSTRCHHADSIHRPHLLARPGFRRTHAACAGACGKSTDHRRHSCPHAHDAASGPSTRHHAEHYRASLHRIPRSHPSGDAPRNRQNRAQELPHHRKQSQPRHVSPRAIDSRAPDRSRTASTTELYGSSLEKIPRPRPHQPKQKQRSNQHAQTASHHIPPHNHRQQIAHTIGREHHNRDPPRPSLPTQQSPSCNRRHDPQEPAEALPQSFPDVPGREARKRVGSIPIADGRPLPGTITNLPSEMRLRWQEMARLQSPARREASQLAVYPFGRYRSPAWLRTLRERTRIIVQSCNPRGSIRVPQFTPGVFHAIRTRICRATSSHVAHDFRPDSLCFNRAAPRLVQARGPPFRSAQSHNAAR